MWARFQQRTSTLYFLSGALLRRSNPQLSLVRRVLPKSKGVVLSSMVPIGMVPCGAIPNGRIDVLQRSRPDITAPEEGRTIPVQA